MGVADSKPGASAVRQGSQQSLGIQLLRLLPDRDVIVMCCDCYVSTVPTAMQGDGWFSVSISFMMNMSRGHNMPDPHAHA